MFFCYLQEEVSTAFVFHHSNNTFHTAKAQLLYSWGTDKNARIHSTHTVTTRLFHSKCQDPSINLLVVLCKTIWFWYDMCIICEKLCLNVQANSTSKDTFHFPVLFRRVSENPLKWQLKLHIEGNKCPNKFLIIFCEQNVISFLESNYYCCYL